MSNQHKEGGNDQAPHVPILHGPQTDEERAREAREKTDREEQQRRDARDERLVLATETQASTATAQRWTNGLIALFTFFLLVVSTIGNVIAWKASVAAQTAAKAAQNAVAEAARSRRDSERQAANALKASIAIAQNTERAWIVAKAGVDPIKFGIGDRILMPFHIANIGKTPAFRVDAYTRVELIDTGHVPSFTYAAGTSMRYRNGEMIPGEDVVRDIPARMNARDIILGQSDITALFSGKRYAVVYSDIVYWDSGDRGHWTRFCVEMNLGPVKRDVDRSDGCAEYNGAGDGEINVRGK